MKKWTFFKNKWICLQWITININTWQGEWNHMMIQFKFIFENNSRILKKRKSYNVIQSYNVKVMLLEKITCIICTAILILMNCAHLRFLFSSNVLNTVMSLVTIQKKVSKFYKQVLWKKPHNWLKISLLSSY